MYLRIFIVLLVFFCVNQIIAQTNPDLFELKNGNYSFTEWMQDESKGSYPDCMIFHQTKTQDPELNDEMDSNWELEYCLTSGSRLCGMGDEGISFLNTSTTQDGGKYLGAVVLGLNTIERYNIKVSWTGRTIKKNDRVYSIAFQYKIGSGNYKNTGIVYLMEDDDNSSTKFENILLPEECEDQDSVYLRWKYFFTANDQGARAELGLDDIVVTSEPKSDVIEINDKMDYLFINNKVFISFFESGESEKIIIISDVSGKIKKIDRTNKDCFIDMNSYPVGLYLIKVIDSNYSKVIKIIKS